MANQFTLTMGAKTFTIPIKLTALQFRRMVIRYARHNNIPLTTVNGAGDVVNRSDDEVIDEVFRSLLFALVAVSTFLQRQEEVAARATEIDAVVKADNDLF